MAVSLRVTVRPVVSAESSTVKSIGPEVAETDTPARMLVRCPSWPRLTLVLVPVPLTVTGPPLPKTETLRSPLLVMLTGDEEQGVTITTASLPSPTSNVIDPTLAAGKSFEKTTNEPFDVPGTALP